MTRDVTRHPRSTLEAAVNREDRRAEGLLPGDFILVHSHSQLAPRLIGFGQRLHHDPAFSYWTHAALVVGDDWLIEAKGRHPVRYVPLSQYDVRDYAAVRFQATAISPVMRANAVTYARAQLGDHYGYLTIVTLAIWSILGGDLLVGARRKPICSGLVASAVIRLGEPFSDPLTMEPADLAEWYDVRR